MIGTTSDTTHSVTAGELRNFIERLEHLGVEKRELTDILKDVMAEAEARGHDTAFLRKIIALRQRDQDDIAEEDAILGMYKEVLGM